jgi:uncharacterized membrane protein
VIATLRRRWWLGLVAVFAFLNGILALRYLLLPNAPLAAPLPNVRLMPVALAVHATCAGLALCLGPLQFFERPRTTRIHARIGRAYVVLVVIGGIAAVTLSFSAATGRVAALGFFVLGITWLATTLCGYTFARNGSYRRHARWMLFSFACAAAAITLRFQLVLMTVFGLEFRTTYPLIAWACWVPNVIAIAIFLRLVPAWPVSLRDRGKMLRAERSASA